MKILNQTFILILILTLSFACKKGDNPTLPTSTGTPNEVLLVMDGQHLKDSLGKTILSVLESDVPGLPQSEPNFKVSAVSNKQFDNILKPVRNILIVEISDQYTQPKMSFAKDVWANRQVVLFLKSPDQNSLFKFVQANHQKIIDFFVTAEINRVVKLLRKSHNMQASDTLLAHLNVDMDIPAELKYIKTANNFFWASNYTNVGRMDIVVYAMPYKNTNAFTLNHIIHNRDSVMKTNVPGPWKGSYMSTQTFLKPILRPINVCGKYAAEVRGLWEMKNGPMGGPFVSLTRLDEVNQRVITAEAFVYAPEKNKRNMMRQLEAALYTLTIPKENEIPEVPVTIEK